MHWCKWKDLCISKDKGGLGFRDIGLFNQAMLAKQSWRILRNPDCLLARILRGRYYSNGSFLSTPIGNNPSLTWRSIVWGRDLFIKGIRWRVGSGRHIYIDQDPWINRTSKRTPFFTPNALKGASVSTLMTPSGLWDEGFIRRMFWPNDAEDILNIRLASSPTKDEIIWAPDSKGIFSIKSTYHLETNIRDEIKDSPLDDSSSKILLKKLWSIKLIPGAKICVWKVINYVIPSKSNLNRRGMDVNPLRVLCRCKEESSTHVV